MAVNAAVVPQPRVGMRVYLGDIVWAARIIAAIAIILASGEWPMFWHHVGFLAGLAILTYPVRAARWGTIYNLFLAGCLFSFVIIGVQFVIEQMILRGEHQQFGAVVVAPLTEEILKILPLVVLLLIPRFRFRYGFGAVDLMVCAAALGAGFGLIEDVLRRAESFPGPVTPRLLGYPVFSDSYNTFIGHGGSTAFIGLTIGWLVYSLRRRILILFGLLAVAVATSWMMFDHATANLKNYSSYDEWFAPVRWLWILDRRGELSPYIVFIALVATMVFERVLLWRCLRRMPRLSILQAVRFIVRPLQRGVSYASFRKAFVRLRRLSLYVLSFRQLGYLVFHLRGDRPLNRKHAIRQITRSAREIAMTQLAVRRA